ncbi:hypothetical protein F2Q70_00041143 [Brassica cretica]|uniref:VASt domain-containing protein n=1 Tax=Brassica cretica TaxID=69181 RepID=A0A8S9K5Y0_BRACR|nr:hypothetical protein F2Q70_00041143 [Brassica cretica]
MPSPQLHHFPSKRVPKPRCIQKHLIRIHVHCRWRLEVKEETSSVLDVRVGVHFKKWCLMQSKIKSGAIDEYKKEVEVMLEVALSHLKSHSSSSSGGDTDKNSALSLLPIPENTS